MLQTYAIADILFLIVGAVCLTNFLDDCMEPGMVFSFWGAWIKKEVREELLVPAWKKPLGACIFCMNVWVIFLIAALFVTIEPAAFLLASVGLGNSILKLILKYNL